MENETNNSEKINIGLSILYISKFLLLFGTRFPFITARYLFSFLKIIVLARFKKLNVILIIYTLFFVISYWKFSFIYNSTGNNNIITKNSISSLKGNNILYKTSFSETRTEICSKFDQVIYNQNNFYNTKININTSIILANLLMSIAFIIKNNFNRKTKIFFYFFLVNALIIITVLKSSNQPPDSFKELKTHPTKEFFTIESLKLIHKIINLNELKYFRNITLGKIKYKHHCLFFKFIILLSGDVNLNPGPQNNAQQQNLWDNFSKRGLHLIHLNINSLLPKIEELRSIAKSTNAAVIGISESKLDKTIFNAEISIEGYDIIRKDRNRSGGGVACYVRNDICYNSKQILQDDIENIFIDLLLPKTKPITVGIVYKPPHQTGFIEKITANFNSLNVADTEMYVFGDLNINLLQNSKYILENTKNITKSFPDITADAKKYIEFCQTYGLKQLIRSPTRITCHTSTLLDHIITNTSEKVSLSGTIDIALSDHQLIFCTRKIRKQKYNSHKQISFRSFKNYTVERYEEVIGKINSPNYESYSDTNKAYLNFLETLENVISEIAPMKSLRIKNRINEWFDGEIAEKINERDKLFRKFKHSKLHIDEEIYKNAKYEVQRLIKTKKKTLFEEKLKANVGKPKELWKALKSLGLPNKKTTTTNICLKDKTEVTFDSSSISEIFKSFYSTLASNLVKQFPPPKNRFDLKSVEK